MNNTAVHNDHTVLAKQALGAVPVGLTQNLDSTVKQQTFIPSAIRLFSLHVT